MGEFLGAAGIGTLMAGLGSASSAVDAAMQYHYAKKMYQHRYQWAAKDMKKAGFNPILAATGGNVSGMSSAPSTDFSGAVNSGMSAALNFARTRSDLAVAESNIDKTEAETKYTKSKTLAQDITNEYLPDQQRGLAAKALAEASTARSLATINEARSEFAKDLAQLEVGNKRLTNSALVEENLQRRYDWQSKELDYYQRPKGKEAIFWDRLDRASKAVGRGVNSALGFGKLKALSRAIR